jgi:hypothetical protein
MVKLSIDGKVLAYGTNISFSDDVTTAPVGGLGSYSYDTLEPTSYAARGSFSLIRYTEDAKKSLTNITTNAPVLPSRLNNVNDNGAMKHLMPTHFNPTSLLTSSTFNIEIYEGSGSSDKIFTLKDCRMIGYSITFTPGQLVSENIGFMCIKVIDHLVQGQLTENI